MNHQPLEKPIKYPDRRSFFRPIPWIGIIVAATLAIVFVPVTSRADDPDSKKLEKIQVPDVVSDELAGLLGKVPTGDRGRDPEMAEDFSTIDPGDIENFLEFVLSDKKEGLYHADRKKFSKSESAYYEFDITERFDRLLEVIHNPGIPSFGLAPSSMRTSNWV